MKNVKNDLEKEIETQVPQVVDEVALAIKKVNQANEASVLMSILCEKMGLIPSKTSHQEFVQTFSDLQKASLEAQKMLQEKFIATPIPEKRRKTRQLKNV